MAETARKRDIETILGLAEFLPFKEQKFDLILIVTAFEFFKVPLQALTEVKISLKLGGQLIIAILEKSHSDMYYSKSRNKQCKFSSGNLGKY